MIVDRRALLVGIQDYGRLPLLRGREKDCELMEIALRNSGWSDIERVPGTMAGSGPLRKSLRRFLSRLEPTTGAILYFSGHGLSDAEGLRLMPIDGLSAEDGIPISDLLGMVNSVGYIIFLLECCNAGDIRTGLLDSFSGSVAILSATSKTAQARTERGAGLLARHFVETIQSGNNVDALLILRNVKQRLNDSGQPAILFAREGPHSFNLVRYALPRLGFSTASKPVEPDATDIAKAPCSHSGPQTLGPSTGTRDETEEPSRMKVPQIIVVWRDSRFDVLEHLRMIAEHMSHPTSKRYLASHQAQTPEDSLTISGHHIFARPTLLDDTGRQRESRLDPRKAKRPNWKYRLRHVGSDKPSHTLSHIYIRARDDGFSVEFDNAKGLTEPRTFEVLRYVFAATLHPALGAKL